MNSEAAPVALSVGVPSLAGESAPRPQRPGIHPFRPHLLARSALVDRVNDWLARAWKANLCTRPLLEPDRLWRSALSGGRSAGESGGRCESETADFRLRLERICAALENEADLNPLGRILAHGQLVRVIRQRVKLGELWQARPELLQARLAPPIIVVGQMRSGTTRIHRLLASDPAHAGTRFCDSWHPCPPASPLIDARPVLSALSLFVGRRLNPWLDAIHPFGVTRPDEELGWLAAALDHCAYEAQWRIPSYSAFSEAHDPAPVYAEFARILRTDAATRGNARLPRVLKVPQFAEDMAALLAQFPEARVVRTRRDLAQVEASAVSLVANQMAMQSDSADLAWIEAECRRKIGLREKRMEVALAGFGGALATTRFDAFDRGWKSEIAQIYAALGLDLQPPAVAEMQAEQDRAARTSHHSPGKSCAALAPA